MEEKIYTIIMNTLEQVNQGRENPIDLARGRAIELYGRNGVFDSMGLVSFLVSIEEAIQDQLGMAVTLVSEKAVSQRVSPFSSVAALIRFVTEEFTHCEPPGSAIPAHQAT